MRIGILGLGGIGGFIGAPLAKHYSAENQEDVQLVFICRGDTKKEIEKNGLTLTSYGNILNVRPHLVSDNPQEIGVLDVLLVTTKSFSLVDAIGMYRSCLNQDSTVITLQNMVNAKEVIQNTYKNKFNVLEGCIYVASNIKAPGQIKHLGGPGKIFIGNGPMNKYEHLIKLFRTAEIDMSFEENISPVLWKKYLFVAPVAAITTAHNVTFGELLSSKSLIATLEAMMREIKILALSKGIELTEDDIQISLELLSKFPYKSKSSLQLDYENRNERTEKHYLIDYIINECEKENIQCSSYRKINELILKNKAV